MDQPGEPMTATQTDRGDQLPRLLDIPDLAERLNTSIRHVRRLVAEQRIPVVRVGRLIRFDPDDIARWITDNRRDRRRPPSA